MDTGCQPPKQTWLSGHIPVQLSQQIPSWTADTGDKNETDGLRKVLEQLNKTATPSRWPVSSALQLGASWGDAQISRENRAMARSKSIFIASLLTVLSVSAVAAAPFGGASSLEVSGGAMLARSRPPTPLPMIMPPQIQQQPDLNLRMVPSLRPSLPELQPLPELQIQRPAPAVPAQPAQPAQPVEPRQ